MSTYPILETKVETKVEEDEKKSERPAEWGPVRMMRGVEENALKLSNIENFFEPKVAHIWNLKTKIQEIPQTYSTSHDERLNDGNIASGKKRRV